MFAEERFLEKKFGQVYLDWSIKAPAFIPDLKNFIRSDIPFSIKSVLRREYSGVLATVVGFIYVDFLKNYFTNNKLEINKSSIYILLIVILITFILKVLKHYTKLLYEEDRS